jgi:hypothetical protein
MQDAAHANALTCALSRANPRVCVDTGTISMRCLVGDNIEARCLVTGVGCEGLTTNAKLAATLRAPSSMLVHIYVQLVLCYLHCTSSGGLNMTHLTTVVDT